MPTATLRPRPILAIVSIFISSTIAITAHAQTAHTDAPQNLDSPEVTEIEVTGERDSEFIPYKEFYENVEKFNALKDRDRISLVLRVTPIKKTVNLETLKVRLAGDDYSTPIQVSRGGLLNVPIEKEALEKNADFVFTGKQGSVRAEVNVLIKVSGKQIKYRDLMDGMKQANAAERALMNFAQRIIFPNSNAIAVGYAPSVKETAVIHSLSQGDIKKNTNSKGILGIEFSEELYAENPMVEFGAEPDWMIATFVSNRRDENN